MGNYYLASFSLKFHEDPFTNVCTRVINAHTCDKTCVFVFTTRARAFMHGSLGNWTAFLRRDIDEKQKNDVNSTLHLGACKYYISRFPQILGPPPQSNTNIKFLNEYEYICKWNFHQIWILNIFISRRFTEYEYPIYSFLITWPNTNTEYICS